MGIKVIKFGADWCGPCQSMSKRKVLEKFQAKHADVAVEKVDLPEEPAEGEENTNEDSATKRADVYKIDALPTIVIEDHDGEELVRSEEISSLGELEELFEKATKSAARRAHKKAAQKSA